MVVFMQAAISVAWESTLLQHTFISYGMICSICNVPAQSSIPYCQAAPTLMPLYKAMESAIRHQGFAAVFYQYSQGFRFLLLISLDIISHNGAQW